MADIKAEAFAAQALLDNETFQDVVATIRADAIALFSNASSAITEIEAAHSNIKAVETVLQEIQRRIDAGKLQDKRQKKEQHRGND